MDTKGQKKEMSQIDNKVEKQHSKDDWGYVRKNQVKHIAAQSVNKIVAGKIAQGIKLRPKKENVATKL